jgi:DNA replication and repair protein RecF
MIKSLTLYNFRKYRSVTFTFSEGVNYIYGANAQGKTTILEALHCLITGRSFRTIHHKELIREGERGYYLETHFVKEGVDQTLSLSFDGSKKKVLHNETPLSALTALFGILRGVILLPEDEMLIKGTPAHRRLYCDLNLAQIKPFYLQHLSRYLLALKQRNVLLKEKREDLLGLFEKQMAFSASHLTIMRQQLITTLSNHAERIHRYLTEGKEHLELLYLGQKENTQEPLERHFIDSFLAERKRALFLGYSTLGPHRDDLDILLSKKEARIFASEGQKRSAVAALRLAQWHNLKEASEGCSPLLCIDDVGLALDSTRTKLLYEYTQPLGQLFLTSCKECPSDLETSAHFIRI